MIVREKKKAKNLQSYAFVGIVIMVILAIMSTNLTFASEDPNTWVTTEITNMVQSKIDYMLELYRDESYQYYFLQLGNNANYITLVQTNINPYKGATTNALINNISKVPDSNDYYYQDTTRYLSGITPGVFTTDSLIRNDTVLIDGSHILSDSIYQLPLLELNFDILDPDDNVLLSVEKDIINGTGSEENPLITYTNTETSNVSFSIWSDEQSNITILEPTKWASSATIGTGKIPFIMNPNETIKVKWNSGSDIHYSVREIVTEEYISDSITVGEIFTYTNNTGIDQDVRVFADNGVRAVIRLVQNVQVIEAGTPKTIPVLPNQTITFVVLEGSVTAKISDYTPIEEPQIYDPSKVLNIIAPNNNTITANNDIKIRFSIERPRIENPQIQFKLNNETAWYPLDFSEAGFRVEDNSTLLTIKRTYEVPIRLLGNQVNNLRIRVINAGMTTQEETVTIIHKSFEDDGTGKDVITGEDYNPDQMPPLDGNEDDMMGIPNEDDYEDSIFGQLKYLTDTIINAITMPFRFIGEALVHISDWFIESASWIGTMNNIMRQFIGFVPREIQDAILVLIYATVIFSVFALMRK